MKKRNCLYSSTGRSNSHQISPTFPVHVSSHYSKKNTRIFASTITETSPRQLNSAKLFHQLISPHFCIPLRVLCGVGRIRLQKHTCGIPPVFAPHMLGTCTKNGLACRARWSQPSPSNLPYAGLRLVALSCAARPVLLALSPPSPVGSPGCSEH